MRLEAGRLLVEVDETGRIVDVAVRGQPDRSWLSAVDLGVCRVDGDPVDWTSRVVSLDADEIAVRLSGADLEIQLRHSLSTGWSTRLLVVNTGTTARTVERLELTVRPAPGQRLSALAAGARLCWATQAADGDGPLLTARLGAGAVHRVTADGLELGPLRLAPGQRYVTQLRWEVFATARSVAAGPGRDVLVSRTAYELDEAVLLPDDPDAALVTPRDVCVDVVDEPEAAGRELSVGSPGRHRIELRSADGDVRLDLCWVRSVAEQLKTWAELVLAGPRSSAGVVMLDDLPAAIVVQTALGAGQSVDAEPAADALDRLTATLLDRPPSGTAPDPLAVLYLLGEHGRTGDPDVLELALSLETALLADEGPPPPGLGLAVLRTVLAGITAPDRVAPLVARAVERASVLGTPVGDERAEDDGQAAELELLLAVRPLLPADHQAHQRLVSLVRRLGASLGSGLPGRLVTPPPVAQHAHLVAVLRLLPEDGVPGATRAWAATPSLLGHRLTLEVLDRLGGSEETPTFEAGPAAAWLALVPRHA